MAEKYVINVYDGDYGLVSLDIDCIQSVLYAKAAKVPYQLKVLNNIRLCTLNSAPSFANSKFTVSKFDSIVKHLRNQHYNLEFGMSSKQCSEALALENMVKSLLRPSIEYTQWIDTRNCQEFSKPWYMKALPLPFNYVHIKTLVTSATNLIESMYPVEENMEVIKDCMVKNASHCLSSLSARLGKSSFFFGDSISMLDIVVYSHIAFLMKIPFPTNEISSLVSLWPNLVAFVKRIDAKYFSEVAVGPKYLKQDDRSKQNDDEVSYGAIFILSLSAVSLIVSFAVSKGIIQFGKAN